MADLNIPAAPLIEGTTHVHSGKVRDLYAVGDDIEAARLAAEAAGRTVHWSIELNSPNNLKRQGWSRTSAVTFPSISFPTTIVRPLNAANAATTSRMSASELLAVSQP